MKATETTKATTEPAGAPEPGIHKNPSTYELMLVVRKLAIVKKRNEETCSQEDLQGRYKKSYDRLCSDLKEKQCQLRVRYTDAARHLQEVMAASVYADPGDEYQWLHDEMVRVDAEAGKDALLRSMLLTFSCFFDEEHWRDMEWGKKKTTTKPADM